MTDEEYIALQTPVRKYILSHYKWHDWEDLLQEVMIQLWRNRHKYNPSLGKSADSWAVGFAHFVMRNHYRFARRRPTLVFVDQCEQEVTFSIDEDPEYILRAHLSQRSNAVLTCLMNNMNAKQTGEMLDMGPREVNDRRTLIRLTLYDLWPWLADYGRGPQTNTTDDNKTRLRQKYELKRKQA